MNGTPQSNPAPRRHGRALVRTGMLAFAAATSILAACSAGPDYVRPTLTAPPAWKEVAGWVPAQPADQTLRGDWWTMFGDASLNALESRVDVSNQNLRAAAARLVQARAQVLVVAAAGLPQVTAGAAGARSRVSANVVGRSLAGTETNDFALPLSVSWEPDLWGALARGKEAARADAEASAADVESLRLSVHADLASTYFQARSLDAEAALLRHTVADDEKALRMTQDRERIGISSAVDLAQARAQLATVRAQLVELGVARAAAEHAVAVLVGEPPSTFTLPEVGLPCAPSAARISAPPAIPLALPSTLLQRRPDVAAAERRAAAANARLGVQQAALFPALILGGTAGVESAAMSSLLNWPSRFWSLGPQLAGVVFDGGARRARKTQAEAGYDAAVDDYRQSALVAFQEVEDDLAALRILADEAGLQDAAVAQSRGALALLQDRYRVGVVAYVDIVVAQTTALAAQRQSVDLARRRLLGSVQLVKALGGGWQPGLAAALKL
jgi:NodT family efflux transporter outer membrane factor (OMF) lipoprotein